MDVQFLVALGSIVSAIGGAGGAWGAASQRIKHTEREMADVKADLNAHEKNTRVMGERLARIEGKLDLLVTRIAGE